MASPGSAVDQALPHRVGGSGKEVAAALPSLTGTDQPQVGPRSPAPWPVACDRAVRLTVWPPPACGVPRRQAASAALQPRDLPPPSGPGLEWRRSSRCQHRSGGNAKLRCEHFVDCSPLLQDPQSTPLPTIGAAPVGRGQPSAEVSSRRSHRASCPGMEMHKEGVSLAGFG
jgi:hypothetical protein